MNRKGKFIVVEGLEGAGKTTAIQTIIAELELHGITQITQTREPGGTPLAEAMRALIKEEQSDDPLTDMSELLLLYAARSQLVENVIKPALAQGHVVVGDRHDMSSQAYQGGGRAHSQHVLLQLRQLVLGEFTPDLTLYMDLPPELGLERARARGELDRIEKMDLSFFNRIRERYLKLAQADDRVVIIDASLPLEEVTRQIQHALKSWIDNAA